MPPTNHSTQPDHCSAGAGSTRQSKQRAGSGTGRGRARRSAKRPACASVRQSRQSVSQSVSQSVHACMNHRCSSFLRMPAASARRAAKVIAERKRGAEHSPAWPSSPRPAAGEAPTALRLPATAPPPPARPPARPAGQTEIDRQDEGRSAWCLGAQGAANADNKVTTKVRSRNDAFRR